MFSISGFTLLNWRRFYLSETGAITTDYIILTGAIVGLGLSATVSVRTGVDNLGADIDSSLSGASVALMGNLDGTPLEVPYQRLAYSSANFENMRQMNKNYSTASLLSTIASLPA